jgi:inner membrane protein
MFITHLVFGFLMGLCFLPFLNPPNQVLFMTFVMIASALPDIDHPDSKFGKWVKPIGWLFEHRGFFHSLFAVALFSFAAYYFTQQKIVLFAVLIGYVSHILIDSINHKGIMPFHPLSRFTLKGFIASGGVLEYILLIVFVALGFWKLFSL